MARWARLLLIVSMIAWTGMTALAGLFALQGGTRAAASDLALYDTVLPDGTHAVQYGARRVAEEIAVAAAAQPAATPAPLPHRTTGRAYPVPQYAAPAGVQRNTRAVDGAPRRRPALRGASKGVVVLDPGHGRGDPGATHYLSDGSRRWDITEAESNLRNAELIRDNLRAMGYEVYLTRDGEGRGPGRPLPLQFITSDLYARVALAKAVDADVYLAIHGNGASVKSISGPETWYCGKHDEAAANEELARVVQQAMMDALHEYGYDPPDRGIKEDAASHHSGDFCLFVVTRETPVPAALLEFLFLSNDDDARVLVDDRSHVLMAQHVAAALDRFMQQRRGEAP